MTNPSLYRDDSRVRHMLDAMERISELSRGLERDQLRQLKSNELQENSNDDDFAH